MNQFGSLWKVEVENEIEFGESTAMRQSAKLFKIKSSIKIYFVGADFVMIFRLDLINM